jgi:exopolyphosphatase/pppGpp-phosphohydrolase
MQWQRALLLPASLTILASLSGKLGLALEVGMGGLREGVIHEMVRAA